MGILEIQEMTRLEHLQAMEMLWDSLCNDEAGSTPPEWHKEVLAARKQKIDSGKAKLLPLAQVKEF